MDFIRLTPLILTALFLALLTNSLEAQQIYKWTDASGRVHYAEKKPENAAGAQTLDIAPGASTPAAAADTDAEIARIKGLSEQMARERRAMEQARQEQAIRNLEQQNQQLQQDLLSQQLQENQKKQENENNDNVIVGYPPYYAYPPPYPPHRPRFYPPPCQPWPRCHQPLPLPHPPEPPKPPVAKPNPPFTPKPIGLDSGSPGPFRGR
ncbi:MAG: DUF4124 domain-containing protein [Candidatus Competibacteraceae bacterium]|nr:DUF4124 domain-containing protein [Candidatus Competibacteraceae bacterium]